MSERAPPNVGIHRVAWRQASWTTSESWACWVRPRCSISTSALACASPGSKARSNDVTFTVKVRGRPVHVSGMPPIPNVWGCETVTKASSTSHRRAQDAVTSMVTVWPSGLSVALSATSTVALGRAAASPGAARATGRNATALARTSTDATSRRWCMAPPLLLSLPLYAPVPEMSPAHRPKAVPHPGLSPGGPPGATSGSPSLVARVAPLDERASGLGDVLGPEPAGQLGYHVLEVGVDDGVQVPFPG